MDPEERPQQLPSSFPCLRAVPGYSTFIKERFERCLDLYLCPRTRRQVQLCSMNLDSSSVLSHAYGHTTLLQGSLIVCPPMGMLWQ